MQSPRAIRRAGPGFVKSCVDLGGGGILDMIVRLVSVLSTYSSSCFPIAPEFDFLFKGLRPPAADPQQNEGMMLRGYENHEAIALVTCAS